MRDEQNEHPNLAGQLIMASAPPYLVHSFATSITIPILTSNIWSKFHTSLTGYFILIFLWKPNTIWITKIEGILFIFYISWCETGCIYSQWKRLIFFFNYILWNWWEIGLNMWFDMWNNLNFSTLWVSRLIAIEYEFHGRFQISRWFHGTVKVPRWEWVLGGEWVSQQVWVSWWKEFHEENGFHEGNEFHNKKYFLTKYFLFF